MKTPIFKLRYDYATTVEGRSGGLEEQTTEWKTLVAKAWDEAKIEARALVNAINPRRFDRGEPQHLQGCCLVEFNEPNTSFRTLSFRMVA